MSAQKATEKAEVSNKKHCVENKAALYCLNSCSNCAMSSAGVISKIINQQ